MRRVKNDGERNSSNEKNNTEKKKKREKIEETL
jgi:hypothetical protein